ncbi:hypothetical protein H6G41_14670 [Tolypothrix sp. FACHB-123]|uniref:pectate lyase family protein n=1 Tax=Tolypothrix sp. FACHB-123 TaxID=2692868 RepID=UPI001684FEC2|nr:hypothetical protein [Tolypothrix sp. FACHB-123]MBD2355845.1 hypothetical protein [Tolypothrix sp. FACHB-123]
MNQLNLLLAGLSWGIVLLVSSCAVGNSAEERVKNYVVKNTTTNSQHPLAFPGAEGFGATSVGGRGGRVIEVTNLNDSGPGSLRAALEAEGARIVVFRVAGVITLKDTIRIKNSYLTVAGQTAPGGGIILKGTDNNILNIRKGAHDIIIRYLRLRNGSGKANGSGHDNLTINGGYNIIVDHVSLSWSTDENASLFRTTKDPGIYNVTIQRSIMAEGLKGHSNGLIVTGRVNETDPTNPIEDWRKISQISIHHNLFAHNTHRNPRVTSAASEIINNVMYNWKYQIGETTRGSIIDVVNNYAKPGPMSNTKRLFLHEDHNPQRPNDLPYPDPSIYTSGNVVAAVQVNTKADNWGLWQYNFSYKPLPDKFRRYHRLTQPKIPVTIESADAAYNSVLADVGANARLDCLGNWIENADAVDKRILNDVRNNTGPKDAILNPSVVGGYPQIAKGSVCSDRDRDGMPDEWELKHGFNPDNPLDGSQDADADGYTNVEEYLNGSS